MIEYPRLCARLRLILDNNDFSNRGSLVQVAKGSGWPLHEHLYVTVPFG